MVSLRPLSMPEYDDGIQAVRTWTLDWLYEDLHLYTNRGELDRLFLTTLMRMVSLGSAFDPRALRHHLPQVRSVFGSAHRPQALLRRVGHEKKYVVSDLTQCVYNEHRASLDSGILFVK